ncbi:3'-5' exoribonuclease Csl4 [Plasmodium yoelii]|nr:3'-5' exoribonuclease Csl4 [Plasmodium yoelii]WBY56073.1 exosome complex component CSL4 [Plasmodium yoelii yoelii]CDU17053.1 3'-5' exoribonuclease Csl4 homolog, putative [Plasmodium yoelii]VTZ75480.1 exosome complex component CSL4, putative [Plasmodium yoelii]|eukprot:XP_731258.2 3'-5' exoribonuclease Csl4 [Plasmodium yoelii]
MDNIVLPGEVVGNLNNYISGNNTYILNNEIRSTILGKKNISINNENKEIINIDVIKDYTPLPQVGDLVICKVYRVTFNMIYCNILLTNNKPLKNSLKGYINKSDIHIYEGDLGDNFDCFKQGDIIKAKVLSIGQHSSYKLSTVGSDLGVIIALSEKGDILQPAAWNLMVNLSDMSFEQRKVSNEFSFPCNAYTS